MKAITVYQPWASLIIAGAKPYEFRGWNPRERGAGYARYIGQRHVIHAAKRRIQSDEVQDLIDALEQGGIAAASTCLWREPALPVLRAALAGELPLSAGLGTAVLGEPKSGFEIATDFGVPLANDSDRDAEANWGWPMLDVQAWAEPVPMRGLQGFWGWPTPEGVGL